MKRFACLAAACVALAGCDQLFQNRSARGTEEAEKKYNAGEYREAVQFYESALDGTAKSADIHYRLGLIYEDKLKEPLNATHHFQRYLDLAPQGSHARDARNFLKEDEQKLSTSLNGPVSSSSARSGIGWPRTSCGRAARWRQRSRHLLSVTVRSQPRKLLRRS